MKEERRTFLRGAAAMRITNLALSVTVAGVLAIGSALTFGGASAQQSGAPSVAIDGDDLGGVVRSAKGPEAGVWVVAETTGLRTKFAKIAVTDDQGRYVVPDLPKVNYNVWVRGYGLVDSEKVSATPGKALNLTAAVAPDPAAAAEYYPAGYWFSLMKMPDKKEFPGTGPSGNGIGPNIKSQGDWVRNVKSGTCLACHQLGGIGTRKISAALGTF